MLHLVKHCNNHEKSVVKLIEKHYALSSQVIIVGFKIYQFLPQRSWYISALWWAALGQLRLTWCVVWGHVPLRGTTPIWVASFSLPHYNVTRVCGWLDTDVQNKKTFSNMPLSSWMSNEWFIHSFGRSAVYALNIFVILHYIYIIFTLHYVKLHIFVSVFHYRKNKTKSGLKRAGLKTLTIKLPSRHVLDHYYVPKQQQQCLQQQWIIIRPVIHKHRCWLWLFHVHHGLHSRTLPRCTQLALQLCELQHTRSVWIRCYVGMKN